MNRPRQNLGDLMAIAISPVLIMSLVGSLVFFLLEILYVGRYHGSLQWILFFFVFAAVLIARMSMGDTADRAGLYGLVLGLAVWLALLRFVEYAEDDPLAPWGWAINLGLMAIIWWSAHRLTWDCTLIDDTVDASGVGLLEVAGLEKSTEQLKQNAATLPSPDKEGKNKKPESAGLDGWWQRYCRYREERRRQPHAPGVWVVYFSLAALPLFGLGQAQIPPEEAGRRQHAFWLMCIYAGSGLGLLLTTSFLGLRRYLRQRQLEMPAAISGIWLTLGLFLISLLLVFGAIVPRPGDTNPVLKWTGIGSRDRETSSWGKVGGEKKRKHESGDKGEGAEDKEKNSGAKGQESDNKEKRSGAKGEGSEEKKNEEKGSLGGKNGKDKEGGNGGDGKSKHEENKDKKGKKEEGAGGKDSSRERKDGQGPPPSEAEPASNSLGDLLKSLGPVLKWIVVGILLVVIAFFLLRAGLKFLANFTDWARRLLAALQAWWQGLGTWFQRRGETAPEGTTAAPAPPRPFSTFRDPFLTGTVKRLSPGELVRYTFEAFEAWARERDLARQGGETPLEFGQRIGAEVPTLEEGGRRLCGLYASLAYARGGLPASCKESLREFWLLLAEAVERPRRLEDAPVGLG